MSDSGKKYDDGKIKMSLLFDVFASELEGLAAVLQYGNNKYANGKGWDASWQRVEEGYMRYRDAEYRHRTARLQGETYDPESGLPHRAHEIINALFQFWFEINQQDVMPLGGFRYWKKVWPKEEGKIKFPEMSPEEIWRKGVEAMKERTNNDDDNDGC